MHSFERGDKYGGNDGKRFLSPFLVQEQNGGPSAYGGAGCRVDGARCGVRGTWVEIGSRTRALPAALPNRVNVQPFQG